MDAGIETVAKSLGISRLAAIPVSPVGKMWSDLHHRWVHEGFSAGMSYLAAYSDVRDNPALLLDGASTLIMALFSYYHEPQDDDCGIAMYAHGDDYHEVVRRRLEALAVKVRELYGGETRVCVDTAPLRERYWAARAGLGIIGMNGQLIVPGAGSYFFIGTILSTADIPCGECADIEGVGCVKCGRCVRACPGKALRGDGSVDAGRCLSYLTIEHRGDLPEGLSLGGRLYGCDVCQKVCPMNATPEVSPIEEFAMRGSYRQLTPERVSAMTQEEFSSFFSHSAIKRAKLSGLRRNALKIIRERDAGDN